MAYGILSFGAYVPTFRLPRKTIAEAMAWANPALKGLARGERAVANWDEDSITLAVEAARNCLAGTGLTPARVLLASTTLPFADRSNSGVVADALLLPEATQTEDLAGSRRAATSALVRLGEDPVSRPTLLLAAECRDARPASPQEMAYGHGAAAVLVGEGTPVATIRGAASWHDDLVDQYRAADTDYDYALEERWVREEGYHKLVPQAVRAALAAARLDMGEIHRVVLPASAATAKGVAKILKTDDALMVDALATQVGDCGAAHPLLMLTHALQTAVPGEKILVIGFGQGADALVLETTPALAALQPAHGPRDSLAARRTCTHYTQFLSLRQRLDVDFGMRAERDNRTSQSAFYRRRRDITGMLGGRCTACNTLQYPRAQVCVKCGAMDTQQDESLSALTGRVKSYTEDWLAYTPLPPYIYGHVEFMDGANCMLEFTDFEPGQVHVGSAVKLVFRIKDFDPKRHFRRYFWKPAPVAVAAGDAPPAA
jgi:hydroxymethylglutaryl-CoA synthase